jgi:hypothetical protein
MRLYDGAWVRTEGSEDQPVQAFKNKRNPALFDIGGYQYDIDGRVAPTNPDVPKLAALLSLSEVRELGLPILAVRDVRPNLGRRIK